MIQVLSIVMNFKKYFYRLHNGKPVYPEGAIFPDQESTAESAQVETAITAPVNTAEPAQDGVQPAPVETP